MDARITYLPTLSLLTTMSKRLVPLVIEWNCQRRPTREQRQHCQGASPLCVSISFDGAVVPCIVDCFHFTQYVTERACGHLYTGDNFCFIRHWYRVHKSPPKFCFLSLSLFFFFFLYCIAILTQLNRVNRCCLIGNLIF